MDTTRRVTARVGYYVPSAIANVKPEDKQAIVACAQVAGAVDLCTNRGPVEEKVLGEGIAFGPLCGVLRPLEGQPANRKRGR